MSKDRQSGREGVTTIVALALCLAPFRHTLQQRSRTGLLHRNKTGQKVEKWACREIAQNSGTHFSLSCLVYHISVASLLHNLTMPRNKLLLSLHSPFMLAASPVPVVERKGVDLNDLGFVQLPAESKGTLLLAMWRIFQNIFRSRTFVEWDAKAQYACFHALNSNLFALGKMLAAITCGRPSLSVFSNWRFYLVCFQSPSRPTVCSFS